MLSVSNDFKTSLTLPRTIDAKIIIGADTLTSDNINQIKRSFNSGLFKTVSKMVELDTNTPIDKGTEIEPQYGVYINNAFEYATLGKYKVKDDPVLKKDTNSYEMVAYDKIVESMVKYELTEDDITYPCSIRNLFEAIFIKIGWDASGIPESFTNSSSQIEEDVYSNLDMTYRDVLDELCTVSCMFLIDIDGIPTLLDKNFLATLTTKSGTNIDITDGKEEKIQEFILKGDALQNGTPTPSSPVDIDVVTGGQYITVCQKNRFNPNYAILEQVNTQNVIQTSNLYTLSQTGSILCSRYTFSQGRLFFKGIYCKAGTYYVKAHVKITNSTDNDMDYSVRNLDTKTDIVALTVKTFSTGEGDISFSFTINEDIKNVGLSIQTNHQGTIEITNLMLSATNDNYEAYTGHTQEINLGKNLFDKANANIINCYVNYGENKVANSATNKSLYIPITGGATYTVSKVKTDRFAVATTATVPENNVALIDKVDNANATNLTLNTSSTAKYLCVHFWRSSDTKTEQEILDSIQIEKGSLATTYSAYKTPIELGKSPLGNYQDFIRNGTGKNLFDADNSVTSSAYATYTYSNGVFTMTSTETSANCRLQLVLPKSLFVAGKTYTVSSVGANKYAIGYASSVSDTSHYNYFASGNNITKLSFTYEEISDNYVCFYLYNNNAVSGTNWNISNIQIEENSNATEYEPYGYKGKWYLHKEIGKVVLDGSETWITTNTNTTNVKRMATATIQNYILAPTSSSQEPNILSNLYLPKKSDDTYLKNVGISISNGGLIFIYDNTYNTDDTSLYKIWLSTHNLILYYPLATPTNTEITDVELIEQLEAVDNMETFKGENHIVITSSTLSTPITIQYVNNVETINEDYMCDTNVEIKEKVFFNSLVFSRASDSDNIFRQDEASITANGLHELKISEFQLLSMTWRDNFIEEMWNYVKNFKYYAYDVNTVGLSFLEPTDEYYLSTFGEDYKTLMLNSDLTLGDGANEKIYANIPKETTTEYKYASDTDRAINKANLIVDKQNNQIEAVVSTVNNLETTQTNNYQEILAKFDDYVPQNDFVQIENSVTQLQTDTYTKTEINTKLTDGSVTKVQTISGTFDENGMRYEKTNAKTSTLINEKGVEVDSSATQSELFFAGYDENINQTIVRTDNINVRNYLTIGENTRIQDYENGGGMFIL